MWCNNSGIGLQEEVAVAYAASITLDPNLGSKHSLIAGVAGDFNLDISIDTDVDLLFFFVNNDDVTNRTITWTGNVASPSTNTINSGSKYLGTFVRLQGKWCRSSFVQVA